MHRLLLPAQPARPGPQPGVAALPSLRGGAHHLAALALLWLMLMAVPQARADALRNLLGSLADGEEMALNDPPASKTVASAVPVRSARTQVVARAGESLDALIRRTQGDSPFKEVLLRRAFTELNPQAFVRGSAHRLVAGAVLQVPGPADVMALLDERQSAPLNLLPGAAMSGVGSVRQDVSGPEERRKWVRFP
jgi:hypothetical protein